MIFEPNYSIIKERWITVFLLSTAFLNIFAKIWIKHPVLAQCCVRSEIASIDTAFHGSRHENFDAYSASLLLYRGNERLNTRFLESSSTFEISFPELSFTQNKPKPQLCWHFNKEPGFTGAQRTEIFWLFQSKSWNRHDQLHALCRSCLTILLGKPSSGKNDW